MQVTKLLFGALLCGVFASAQVLAPAELRDPQLRALQKQYLAELKVITSEVASHSFPYHFYFSRALDLSEKDQQKNDQRSIQFDHYHDQTVLKITGNYFASYSAEFMKPEERARQTYQDVMYPLLQAAVKALGDTDQPQAFAFEISHHFRKKVLGVSSEGVENVVLVLSRDAAKRAVAASDLNARQAAVLEGEAFLNSAPISLYPLPDVEVAQAPVAVARRAAAPVVSAHVNQDAGIPDRLVKNPLGMLAKQPTMNSLPVTVPVAPPVSRDTSPDAVKKLQNSFQADMDRMVQELNTQAHFVRYAPPAVIPFHGGLYLQLSITTTLPKSASGSQYRLSALAFDQHIAHLIRPVLEFVKSHDDLDGIDFSTSIRLTGDQTPDGSPVAVEFIFPLSQVRTYAQFDCTGQQLLDASYVLINGERVSLNLQLSEAGVPAQ